MPRPKTVCDDCLLRSVGAGDLSVTSTSEVVEATGLSQEAIRQRLWDLEEIGLLDEDTKGGTQLWELTEAGEHRVARDVCTCGMDLHL